MERMAPSLIVLPEYELPVAPPPPLEPHAATSRAATSQPTTLNRFISASPPQKALLSSDKRTKPHPPLSPQPLDQAGNVELWLWVLRVHLLERLDQDRGHRPVAVVLVIGWDHIPGCPWRGASGDGDAVRALVVIPVSPLVDVVLVELPTLVGVAQPLEHPYSLLLVRDVEAEFEHPGAPAYQRPLKTVDDVVAALDHVRLGERVHTCDQHVLVVGAVEDADDAVIRQTPADPPQEAVTFFFRGGSFEGGDLDPLRVEVADHVGDGAVLASRVHRLQHDQQRSLVLCVEPLLELEQTRSVLLDVFERAFGTFHAGRRVWVPLDQPDVTVARFGPQQVANLLLGHRRECSRCALGRSP